MNETTRKPVPAEVAEPDEMNPAVRSPADALQTLEHLMRFYVPKDTSDAKFCLAALDVLRSEFGAAGVAPTVEAIDTSRQPVEKDGANRHDAAGVSSSREALLEKGYKTDSRCTWLAIGRCADCGRIHDGRPHGVPESGKQSVQQPGTDAQKDEKNGGY